MSSSYLSLLIIIKKKKTKQVVVVGKTSKQIKKKQEFKSNPVSLISHCHEDCLVFPFQFKIKLIHLNTVIILVLLHRTQSLTEDRGAGKPTVGNSEMPTRQSLMP